MPPQLVKQATQVDSQNSRRPSAATPPPTILTPLQICWQNAWEVLKKYNNITDRSHGIYAAATLLNPSLRKRWFTQRWSGPAAEYITLMLTANENSWKSKYRVNLSTEAPPTHQTIFQRWAITEQTPINADTAFSLYVNGEPTDGNSAWVESNIFIWWRDCPYTPLRQWAFDILSIPAMSAEVERVFSQAGKIISDERVSLGNQMIEATSCLKFWSKNNFISI